MKKSLPLTLLPLSRAATWSSLALASLTPAAFSLAPQVVTAEVVGLADGTTGVDSLSAIDSDGNGSWVATAGATGVLGSSNTFYGVLAGGSTTPSVLRTVQTLGGFQQQTIFRPRVVGTDIAYTSYSPPADPGFTSWINDTLVAAEGMPIGTTGLVWVGSSTPQINTGPNFFLKGIASGTPPGSTADNVVVEYPGETLLIATGMIFQGLGGRVTGVREFRCSPSGNHWTAVVDFTSALTNQPERGILVDGFAGALPGFVLLSTENPNWNDFSHAFITDDRALVFQGEDTLGSAVYRAGRQVIRTPQSTLIGIDSNGVALLGSPSPNGLSITVDGVELDRIGAGGVDSDGDGTADAGWSLAGPSSNQRYATFIEDGEVLVSTRVGAPGSGVTPGIVRAALALSVDVTCDGVPNSSNRPTSVRAIGSDVAAFNDLELRFTNLPLGSVMLPLFSKTPGFAPNPGGSTGNLCLGGAIGRGTAITTNSTNPNVTIRTYPVSMPQPDGFTAVQPGETWYVQAWYRDSMGGVATSNFSEAIAVPFQ